MYSRFDPDARLARRVEGGPEVGSSQMDRVQDILARNEGGDRYTTLQDAFSPRDDGADPFEEWDTDSVAELLRCTIGEADEFAIVYEQMSAEERARLFPNPDVAELIRAWANSGRSE